MSELEGVGERGERERERAREVGVSGWIDDLLLPPLSNIKTYSGSSPTHGEIREREGPEI